MSCRLVRDLGDSSKKPPILATAQDSGNRATLFLFRLQAKLYHATDCVRARGVIVFTGGRPGNKDCGSV
jgi:hypothetical protein